MNKVHCGIQQLFAYPQSNYVAMTKVTMTKITLIKVTITYCVERYLAAICLPTKSPIQPYRSWTKMQ